jgi:hypothetical protein
MICAFSICSGVELSPSDARRRAIKQANLAEFAKDLAKVVVGGLHGQSRDVKIVSRVGIAAILSSRSIVASVLSIGQMMCIR